MANLVSRLAASRQSPNLLFLEKVTVFLRVISFITLNMFVLAECKKGYQQA